MYSELIFIAGFAGTLFHTKLVRRVIDIEIMTLASIHLLFSNVSDNFILVLVILTASEISLAILFLVTNRQQDTTE